MGLISRGINQVSSLDLGLTNQIPSKTLPSKFLQPLFQHCKHKDKCTLTFTDAQSFDSWFVENYNSVRLGEGKHAVKKERIKVLVHGPSELSR